MSSDKIINAIMYDLPFGIVLISISVRIFGAGMVFAKLFEALIDRLGNAKSGHKEDFDASG